MNTKQQKDNRHTFTFDDLSPDSEYEVIIQTRNKEGWADPSHIFKFRTKTKGKLEFLGLSFNLNFRFQLVCSPIFPCNILLQPLQTGPSRQLGYADSGDCYGSWGKVNPSKTC